MGVGKWCQGKPFIYTDRHQFVGDLPALHAVDVDRGEANVATVALQILEGIGEMSCEGVVAVLEVTSGLMRNVGS